MTDCKMTPVQLGKQTIALADCDPNKGGLSPHSPDDAVYINSDYAVIRQSPAEFFKSVGLNLELPYSTTKLVRLLEKLDQLVKLLDPAGRDYTLDERGNPIAFSTQMASFRLICQDTSEYWQSHYQPELCPQTTGAILATLIPQAQAHAWAEAHVASVEETLAPYLQEPVAFRLSHSNRGIPQADLELNMALNMDLAMSAAAYLYPLAGLPAPERLTAARFQWDSYTQALTAWETDVTNDINHLEALSRKAASGIDPNRKYAADVYLKEQARLQEDHAAAKAMVADYQAALTQFRQKHPALVREFDAWDKTDFRYCSPNRSYCGYDFPHPLYGAYFMARGLYHPDADIDALAKKSWVIYCNTNGIGDGCPWTGDQVSLPPLISLVSPGMVR